MCSGTGEGQHGDPGTSRCASCSGKGEFDCDKCSGLRRQELHGTHAHFAEQALFWGVEEDELPEEVRELLALLNALLVQKIEEEDK